MANGDALDYESNPVFTLTIQATDDGSGNLSDTTTVTVDLSNKNHSPVAADDPGSYDAHVLSQGPLGYWQLGEPGGMTAVNIGNNDVDRNYISATLGVAGIPGTDGDTAADFTASTTTSTFGNV